MKYLFSVIVALGLFVSIALVAPRSEGTDLQVTASVPAVPSPRPDPDTYRLTSPDARGSCTIRKIAAPAGGVSVKVSADCDAILPGLSAARYWTEQGDGSVSISREGGVEVALFAVADGNAYESVSPRRPLMALASLD